jgi:hypothetical protein
MALSNKERIGRMLDDLAGGLRPVVDREFQKVYGERWVEVVAGQKEMRTGNAGRSDPDDPQFLLNAIWFHWQDTLGRTLGPAERNYVAELRIIRNRWAHAGEKELTRFRAEYKSGLAQLIDKGAVFNFLEFEPVPHARDIRGYGAVAQRNEDLRSFADLENFLGILLAAHGAFNEHHVYIVRIFLRIHEWTVDEVHLPQDIDEPFIHVEQGHVTPRAAIEPDRGETRFAHGRSSRMRVR